MEVLERIIDLSSEERQAHIEAELKLRFGEIFRMSPDAIDSHASIIELGVDSLIATEIVVALKSQLGVDVPLIELLAGPSIQALATQVLAQLEVLIEDAADAEPAPAVAQAEAAAELADAAAR
jgi:acyl carrier protein